MAIRKRKRVSNLRRVGKEQDIQKAIIDWLRLNKFLVIKHNNVGIRKPNGSYIPTHQKGVSDLIVCAPSGRFIAIEVKRPGNKPTALQKAFLQNVNKMGGVGMWVTSTEELLKDLRENMN